MKCSSTFCFVSLLFYRGRWTPKLFLQPLYNMKVVYIAITLLCVCILLIVIISVLQWLEIREDRTEKQKEAQRFHFDAM